MYGGKSTFMKVMSIVLLLSALNGIASSCMSCAAIDSAKVYMGEDYAVPLTLLMVVAVLNIINCIVRIFAAAVGFKNCNDPDFANKCLILGIIIAVLGVITYVILLLFQSFNIIDFLSVLLAPLLYLIAAFLIRAERY